jgi:integrase
MLGLTGSMVNLDASKVEIRYGLQRIGGRLVHGETKTIASDVLLPLPDICGTALRLQQKSQTEAKAAARLFWVDSGYVFSTRDGLPVDPRNFHRAFKNRCVKAGVPPLPVHGTRNTAPLRVAAGRPGRPPSRSHAVPETQQDRGDDGDLHAHPVRADAQRAAQARG